MWVMSWSAAQIGKASRVTSSRFGLFVDIRRKEREGDIDCTCYREARTSTNTTY